MLDPINKVGECFRKTRIPAGQSLNRFFPPHREEKDRQDCRHALRKFAILSLLILLLTFFKGGREANSQTAKENDLLQAAEEVLQQVIRIRGLEPKGPIRKGVRSKKEIQRYLTERIHEEYQESELRSEGKALQKLGLIPTGIDYKELILELLTEQVGGYYDPDKKVFYIADWLPVEQQKQVMAHELTHALQDRHFDLGRFLMRDRKLQNDDIAMAHSAVVEGDGTAVMLDYVLQPTGMNFSRLPNLVGLMRSQFPAVEEQYNVFKQAPMFLKESLMFPYAYGLAFLQRVHTGDSWSAVNRLYSDLPASTEQIIHPEKYLEIRDNPRQVEINDPAPHLGKKWKSTYRNVLGEFTLYLLLKLYLSEEQSLQASAGWGGDRLLLAETSEGAGSIVFMESVWDTLPDAEEFYAALEAWLPLRFPRSRRVADDLGGAAWVDGDEYHRIQRKDVRVRFIIGFPRTEVSKLKGYWP